MKQWPWLGEPWTGAIPGCQCQVTFPDNLSAVCHVYDNDHHLKTLPEVIEYVDAFEKQCLASSRAARTITPRSRKLSR